MSSEPKRRRVTFAELVGSEPVAPERAASPSPEPPTTSLPQDRLSRQPETASQTTTLDNQPPLVVVQTTGQLDNQIATAQGGYQVEKQYHSRRTRKYKGVRLPVQKLAQWEIWCALNKVDFQELVERGIDTYLGQLDNQTTGQPGNRATTIRLDDLEDSLKDDAIIFYQKWSGNRATEKDRQAYKEVAHLNANVIKAGILTSIMRAKQKINSFRYCIGAIQEIAEAGIGSENEYLRYLMGHAMTGKGSAPG
jgi:hypothetical protein